MKSINKTNNEAIIEDSVLKCGNPGCANDADLKVSYRFSESDSFGYECLICCISNIIWEIFYVKEKQSKNNKDYLLELRGEIRRVLNIFLIENKIKFSFEKNIKHGD